MNCPNCGMPLFINRGDCIEYGCGAMYLGDKRLCGNPSCDEIARLNERVRVLEEVIDKIAKAEQPWCMEEVIALAGGKEATK